jgi:hypothetical protein
MVLGNHDYMGNPLAQIEFTSHPNNPLQLWQMPHNYYSFSHQNADFFALDTNGCQGHVQQSHPGTIDDLMTQMSWLDTSLNSSNSSNSHWKFVIGHHPMYNKGKGHGTVANCLREERFTYLAKRRGTTSNPNQYEEVECQGFGLESVLCPHERVIYLSGMYVRCALLVACFWVQVV